MDCKSTQPGSIPGGASITTTYDLLINTLPKTFREILASCMDALIDSVRPILYGLLPFGLSLDQVEV